MVQCVKCLHNIEKVHIRWLVVVVEERLESDGAILETNARCGTKFILGAMLVYYVQDPLAQYKI